MTDKEFLKKVRKSKKQLDKKHKDDFIPTRLNIKALCEWHNRPEWLTPICNRIYRAAEQDEELFDYIFLDLDEFENIYLDTDGIIVFREILSGYFDCNELADLMCEIRKRNEKEKILYDFSKGLKKFSNKELKEYKKKFENIKPQYDEISQSGDFDECKTFYKLLDLIQAEVSRRNVFTVTVKK